MSDLIERLKAYAAKFGPIDPERAMCLEAVAEIERRKRLLNERDDFIVRKGLWSEFTDGLPQKSDVEQQSGAEGSKGREE